MGWRDAEKRMQASKFNYVKMGNMVIMVAKEDTDTLYGYLWDVMPDDMESLGADTNFENDFGEITHAFSDKLVQLHKN